MFGDLMGKLEEAKKQATLTKERLNSVYVSGTSANGKIKVVSSANSEIKEIEIAPELKDADMEELTDYLVIALNEALGKAKGVYEAEMGAAAKSAMPNIPGMGGLGKMFK